MEQRDRRVHAPIARRNDLHSIGRVRAEPEQSRNIKRVRLNDVAVADAVKAAPFAELVSELNARVGSSSLERAEVRLLFELQDRLKSVVEVPQNRYSKAYLQQYTNGLLAPLRRGDVTVPDMTDAHAVEFGCGSENPLGRVFFLHLLGAARGTAIDLDSVMDERRAATALADTATWLLADPVGLGREFAPAQGTLLEVLQHHNLPMLQAGKLEGVDPERVRFLSESADSVSLPDQSAGLVFSNAFLEHVDSPEAVIKEMARISKPGCVHNHVIDTIDHRHYPGHVEHPLSFLSEPAERGMIGGCNRTRLHEFEPIFRDHGFDLISRQDSRSLDLSNEQIEAFAEPWRSMSREQLQPLVSRFVLVYGEAE